MLFSTSPATTPGPIESCAPLGLLVRAWRVRQAAESHRGLLHARNGSGTWRGPLGSFLWGHAERGGYRQPSGSEGIVVPGSTPLDHAQQSLIAGCDTAGCLPAAGCPEDADSGSRGDVPVDARRTERGRAIAQWCADRLTALLTATLTAVLTEEFAERFLPSATHSNTHRSRSEPCVRRGAVAATRVAVSFPSSLAADARRDRVWRGAGESP